MFSKDWLEVIEKVQQAKIRLGCSKTPGSAFFRGHRVSAWSLSPSIFRYANGKNHESSLYDNYLTRSGNLIDRSKSSWEILAEMRHHGVPTRLLDWTTSFAVALYFALAQGAKNPCIWVLNPFRLSRSATGKPAIYNFGIQGGYDYLDHFVRDRTWPFDAPIAMACPWRIARIEAQQGYFTVHGNDPSPIEEIGKKYVKKIEIPERAIENAWQFLDLSGISEFTLFPDLDGLARWLIKKYNFTS